MKRSIAIGGEKTAKSEKKKREEIKRKQLKWFIEKKGEAQAE